MNIADRINRRTKSSGQLETEVTDERLKRVLRNDPGTGIVRHAEAGYNIAKETAKANNSDITDRIE